jgi:hypothetical protein
MATRKPTVQEIITTPTGIASWPHLNDGSKPYTQEFLASVNKFAEKAMKFHHKYETEALAKMSTDNSPKGKAKRKSHEEMIARLTDVSNFKLPIEEEYDKETGDATGNYILKVKNSDGYMRDGVFQSLKPRMFDAQGTPIAKGTEPLITGGAKLRINAQFVSYCAGGSIGEGLGARISAVQIVDLANSFGSAGFGAVEGGSYSAEVNVAVVEEETSEEHYQGFSEAYG